METLKCSPEPRFLSSFLARAARLVAMVMLPTVAACGAPAVSAPPAEAPAVSAQTRVLAPRTAVSGRVAWTRTFGDDDHQAISALGVDAQGALLIGGSFLTSLPIIDPPLQAKKEKRRPWLAAIEPDGSPRWARQIGGQDSAGQVISLATLADGSLLLAGQFQHADFPGTVLEKKNGLIRFDRDGEAKWTISLGFSADLFALRSDERGGGLIAGRFQKSLVLQDTPFEDTSLDALSKTQYTCFVTRFGEDGKLRWSGRFGGEKGCALLDAILLPGGETLVAGTFSGLEVVFGGIPLSSGGDNDALLMKLDAEGKVRWARHWGAKKTVTGRFLAAGPRGDLWMTGLAAEGLDLGGGPLPDKARSFLAHFDAQGEHLGSWGFSAVQFAGLQVDAAGHPVLLGWATGDTEIGGQPSTGKEKVPELFLTLLDSQGKSLEIERFPRGNAGLAMFALTPRGDLLLGATLTSSLLLRGRQVEHHGAATDEDIFLARFTH